MEANFFFHNFFFPSSKQKLFSFLHIGSKKKIQEDKKKKKKKIFLKGLISSNIYCYLQVLLQQVRSTLVLLIKFPFIPLFIKPHWICMIDTLLFNRIWTKLKKLWKPWLQ